MNLEAEIKEYAHEIGFDLVGFTTAEPFGEALERLQKMKDEGFLSPWAEKDLKKRCDPQLHLENAKSLIAVGVSYLQKESLFVQTEGGRKSDFQGKLARFAQVEDYHLILRELMERLVRFIEKKKPEVAVKIFVDTGPLVDREVAYRAGLGFFGKNASLIHPEYGSYLALGEILLNIPLKPDIPLQDGCGDCQLCLQACPREAIHRRGEIQTNDCLAHFTQEKGFLNPEIRKDLGHRLWGCDTCQEVCPYNQKAQTGQGTLPVHSLGVQPDLEKILNYTNRQYKQQVGKTAMGWRGKTTLQRNALIVLGNHKDPKAIPLLKAKLDDPRPVIRATAAWALGRIGELGKNILLAALAKEDDPVVRKEIQIALDKNIRS